MAACLIALGSNLGDRAAALEAARQRLAGDDRLRLQATSRWHETAPAGGPPGQSPYLNGAALLETALAPQEVLAVLQRIEAELGRRRLRRWGPRRIDLDLLLYDRLEIRTPSLVVPHPRMAWRRFVLAPAAEIAGSLVHPPTGWTVARLLEHLDTTPPYVALAGSIGAGKTHLAAQLSRRLPVRQIAERLDLQRLATFYADPGSHGWETEIQFLEQRGALLSSGADVWAGGAPPVVSDFWFDQSLAFARVWLKPAEQEAFARRWAEVRREVVRPRLIALLDPPGEVLFERTRRRGRSCERGLSVRRLTQIAREIAAQAARPDQGAVLRLEGTDAAADLEELAAAVVAMQ